MHLTIHRGARQIGGTCIELQTESSRILIDVGSPLPDIEGKRITEEIPDTLRESLKMQKPSLAGIFISHPHQDHYGLLENMPNVPVYVGRHADTLINFTNELHRREVPIFRKYFFDSGKPMAIGDFTVTPYLVDHSAFDAYALLIEADGKRIFYSGDFRAHGKKKSLVESLPSKLPEVDLLLAEGTLVGGDREKQCLSEEEIKNLFIKSIKETEGIVFVTLSSMNIDRIVSLYKACNATRRKLIIDPYTAEIFTRLKKSYEEQGQEYTLLDPAKMNNLRLFYPNALCKWLEKLKHDEILKRHRKYGLRWATLSREQDRIVMLIRPTAVSEVLGGKYFDLSKAKWIYSLWKQYFCNDKKTMELSTAFQKHSTAVEFVHTSGHADLPTLKKFIGGIRYKKLSPVHTGNPEAFTDLFKDVALLEDGKETAV